MKRILIASLLIAVSLFLSYGTWLFWPRLTKPAILILGATTGGCLVAAVLMLQGGRSGRQPEPRYQANLPAPWERKRWS